MAGYQHPDHEVLQVSNWAGLHVSDCEGLEVYDHGGLHLGTPSANPELFSQPEPLIAARVEAEHPQHHPKAKPDKSQRNTRIGGLRKPSFWLAFALGVVIIVAAVVGGVLGGLAKKSPFHSRCPFSNAPTANTANETAAQKSNEAVTQTATQIVDLNANETTTSPRS